MKAKRKAGRLLAERPLPRDGKAKRGYRRLARSVTVNLAESPLGWLHARGHVSARQLTAGEMLRNDWERARLAPRVTMAWDGSPPDKSARAAPRGADPTATQLAARRRFREALAAAGPGLADILWRIVCAGEGMREAESALGWPARAGKLVLSIALDRLADHYRLR
ncbi:MAG: DUF6456 domain-containing protein [Sphingomonadaceae bacterium]